MSVFCSELSKELTFLVVDDSHSMRRIITRTLRDMPVGDVLEAEDAFQAMDIMQFKRVDFILCDWNMPGKKGIDFLRELRGMEQFKEVPFLMVSAESRAADIVEAIRCGVSNYLPKPFTPDILKRKIEAILRMRNISCIPDANDE